MSEKKISPWLANEEEPPLEETKLVIRIAKWGLQETNEHPPAPSPCDRDTNAQVGATRVGRKELWRGD